jgi:cytochrome c biogenesis protein CcdA
MAKYWKRIVVAGIAAELLYAVYIYYIAPSTQVAYQPIGFATVFGLFVLCGLWAGRTIDDASRIVAGIWIGIVGTIFYYILQTPDIMAGEQNFPAIAFFNHGLKLAGGALGAVLGGLPALRKA